MKKPLNSDFLKNILGIPDSSQDPMEVTLTLSYACLGPFSFQFFNFLQIKIDLNFFPFIHHQEVLYERV
jgi:hypothetical protein